MRRQTAAVTLAVAGMISAACIQPTAPPPSLGEQLSDVVGDRAGPVADDENRR